MSADRPQYYATLMMTFALGLTAANFIPAAFAQDPKSGQTAPTAPSTITTSPNTTVKDWGKNYIYSVSKKFTTSSGVVSLSDVACKRAVDIPLTGTCTAPQNSGARLQSTQAFNWSRNDLAAAWQCAFFNDSAPVEVEATILCRRYESN